MIRLSYCSQDFVGRSWGSGLITFTNWEAFNVWLLKETNEHPVLITELEADRDTPQAAPVYLINQR